MDSFALQGWTAADTRLCGFGSICLRALQRRTDAGEMVGVEFSLAELLQHALHCMTGGALQDSSIGSLHGGLTESALQGCCCRHFALQHRCSLSRTAAVHGRSSTAGGVLQDSCSTVELHALTDSTAATFTAEWQ